MNGPRSASSVGKIRNQFSSTKFASLALSKFDRLSWQSGAGPFNPTATVNVDLMLGGAGGDILNGAGDDDLLLGGAGADSLDGGSGDETLIGGAGVDQYKFGGHFGHDLIEDGDGAGQIKVDGNPLPAGKKHPNLPNTWVTDDGGWTYVLAPSPSGGSTSTMYLLKTGAPGSSDADTITVNKYTIDQLGITLSSEQATLPPVTKTFTGDFVKKLDETGTWYLRDGLNYVPDPQGTQGPQPDVFLGSFEADRFELGGGNDAAGGGSGEDMLIGGDGDDLLLGGGELDLLVGGAGNDYLYGSHYGSNWQLPSGPSSPPTPAEGPERSRGFGWVVYDRTAPDGNGRLGWTLAGVDLNLYSADAGNLLDGGEGHDWIFAGGGSDVAFGGAGNDELRGLGGADLLLSEDGNDVLHGDGLVLAGYTESTPAAQHGSDDLDGGAGDDVLLGQGGADRLDGGTGDDLLWGDDGSLASTPAEVHGADLLDGEGGDDYLEGGGGDDLLVGGSGADTLWGDSSQPGLAAAALGEDRLDGGEGNDTLVGGGKDDTLFGGAGNDQLRGDGAPAYTDPATSGADYLEGEDGDDLLWGDCGDELLRARYSTRPGPPSAACRQDRRWTPRSCFVCRARRVAAHTFKLRQQVLD